MRLALSLNYSGAAISLDTAKILEAERLGYDSVWTGGSLRLRRRGARRLDRRADRAHPRRHGDHADPRPHAGHDGDDRDDARRALRRPLPPRPRRLRAPGGRGLARPAVRQAARQDPRVRRGRPRDPPPREAGGVPRRVLPDPLRGPGRHRPRQAAHARSCTAAPTCRSIWPRSVRRTSRSPPRSPTAGFRSSSPPAARSCSRSG